jgi:hypothetical protein
MPSSNRGDAFPAARRRALAVWTLLAAQLMLAMDFLIVIVALPRIQADLGFDRGPRCRSRNRYVSVVRIPTRPSAASAIILDVTR